MDVVNWPIEDVKPYENNPRKNDAAVKAVAESIKQFGWQQPIVVDKDGVVIAGHTRLKAAVDLGLKDVPVVMAETLTDEQAKAFRIIDNKTHELSDWDIDALKLELENFNFDFEPFDISFSLDPPDISEMFDEEPLSEEKEKGPDEFFVVIECKDEEDQKSVFRELDTQGLKCSMKTC